MTWLILWLACGVAAYLPLRWIVRWCGKTWTVGRWFDVISTAIISGPVALVLGWIGEWFDRPARW